MSVATIEAAEAGIGADTPARLAAMLRPERDAVAMLLLDRAREFLSFLRPGASVPLACAETDELPPDAGQALRAKSALRPAGSDGAAALAALNETRRWLRARLAPDDARAFDRLIHLGAAPASGLAMIPAPALGLADPAFAAAEPMPVEGPPTGLGSLVLIAKLTRHCNLRCTYCTDWREGPGNQMTAATQALMVRRVAEDRSIAAARFIWHGGEPSLLGVRKMLGFLWLQARLRRPGQIFTNSIQTNAAALPDRVVALWRLFDFKVSVSLDGPRAIHDRQRRTARGGASFDAVIDGIARLREAGIFAGVLIVVTPEIAAYPIERLVGELVDAGVHAAGFLPVRPDAGTGEGPYLPPAAFSDFLIRLFDLLRTRPDLRFDVREIDALHAAWQRQPTGFCELNGPCLGGYFGIEPDGTVRHCDKFLGSASHALGNLAERSFADIRASAGMAALKQREAERWLRLRSCRWYGHCKGWCPHESHVAVLRGEAARCCGLAPIFDHFEALAGAERRRA